MMDQEIKNNKNSAVVHQYTHKYISTPISFFKAARGNIIKLIFYFVKLLSIFAVYCYRKCYVGLPFFVKEFLEIAPQVGVMKVCSNGVVAYIISKLIAKDNLKIQM